MKSVLITLTFALATLTVASAVATKSSNSVVDRPVLTADDPPPICPPICSSGQDTAPRAAPNR